MVSVDVRVEGDRVILIYDGRTLMNLEWEAARDLSRALRIQANKAEENAKAGQLVTDQAILLQAGVPIGLSSNPVIQKEARREAVYIPRIVKGKKCL